jgi:ketosteroid isomerase-like protein
VTNAADQQSDTAATPAGAEAADRATPPPWVRDFYADVDAGNGAAALERLATDVQLQFGARAVANGREAARSTFAAVHHGFVDVSHEFRNVWQAGDTAICEFVATYRLSDESLLPLPTLTVLRRRGEKIASMRVYMDEGPLRDRAPAPTD